jgi:hypothetical protein
LIHGRRLLFASGLPIAQVSSEETNWPAYSRDTFLLPNFVNHRIVQEAARKRAVYFKIPPNWRESLVYAYFCRSKASIFDCDENEVDMGIDQKSVSRLSALTGSGLLEVIGFRDGNDIRFIGIHPCLTKFPRKIMKMIQGGQL